MNATETIYQAYRIKADGNEWSVLTVTGWSNYINVRKVTNNPFRGQGRQFKDWDEAQSTYRSAEIKSALIQIETGLISPVGIEIIKL